MSEGLGIYFLGLPNSFSDAAFVTAPQAHYVDEVDASGF
jgi:hypothetical protein